MSKRDNVNLILMTHCKVNLQCDDKKLHFVMVKIQGCR